jgi:hypothetical protein
MGRKMNLQRWVIRRLPNQSALRTALQTAVGASNGGLGNNMWATLVANDGTVCAVAFSGVAYPDQWLGSRVIAAQKANTANDFSLSNGARLNGMGLALSTANLYSAVQPGGSLYGLQHSNPVDPAVAYEGNALTFGHGRRPNGRQPHWRRERVWRAGSRSILRAA